MIDTKIKKAIRETVVADSITFKRNGAVVFKHSYFYSHGDSAEKFGQRVEAGLKAISLTPAKIETHDRWAAWPRDSYFIAEVTL